MTTRTKMRKRRGGKGDPVVVKETTAEDPGFSPKFDSPSKTTLAVTSLHFTKLNIILATVVFATYVRTLYASIPGGDSGELVAEACKLGHAHPPGYPLFTLMYHVIPLHVLPESLGSVAWRANLLSAILGTFSAVFVSMFTEMLCWLCLSGMENGPPQNLVHRASSWAAVTAGGLFAFSPLVWLYHVGAEVFALNNFFVGLLLVLTAWYATFGGSSRVVLAGAFSCGLALTNQHTIILFEVPLVLWVMWTQRGRVRQSPLVLLDWAWWFLLGLSPYAYLPIAHLHHRVPGSWGDSATVKGFVRHLRRADYGTFQLFSRNDKAVASALERTFLYFEDFRSRQALGHGTLLLLQGLAVLAWHAVPRLDPPPRQSNRVPKGVRKLHPKSTSPETTEIQRTYPLAVLLALAFYLVVFHSLSNMPLDEKLLFGVHARFWMQPNAVLFAAVGVGFAYLSCRLANVLRSLPDQFVVSLFGTFAVGAVVVQLVRSAPLMDQSSNFYLDGYARALIEPLPPNSLLLTNYDQQWTTLRYLQQCEGVRPDVTLMHMSMMTYSWFSAYRELYPQLRITGTHMVATNSSGHRAGGFTFAEFLDANIANEDCCSGGIYSGGKVPFPSDTAYREKYATKPMGLLTMYRPFTVDKNPDTAIPFSKWFSQSVDTWAGIRQRVMFVPEAKYDAETWEWTVNRDKFEKLAVTAADILHEAIERKNILMMALASGYLEECFTNDRQYITASAVKNLGLAYVRMVQSKLEFEEGLDIPNPVLVGKQDTWKNVASHRALLVWSQFLAMPGVKDDPGYNDIVRVVKVLNDALASEQKN